jgi:hypothetical protein
MTSLSPHDGVEEENMTEHDEADDTSQAEDSQPYNRAVQSITTDKEDKDIEAKGNKSPVSQLVNLPFTLSFSLKILSVLQP